jgi:hypothetical protein
MKPKNKESVSEVRKSLHSIFFELGEAQFAIMVVAALTVMTGNHLIVKCALLLCLPGVILMGLIVFVADPLLVRLLKKQRPNGTPVPGYPGAVVSWI